MMSECKLCARSQESFAPVLPDGDIASYVSFKGSSPGKIEDARRVPLYPDAPVGRVFSEFLRALSLRREMCYISDTLRCHSENDRPTTQIESINCSKFNEIEFSYQLVCKKNGRTPEIFFLMGNEATLQFLGHYCTSVLQDQGKVFVMRHPTLDKDLWFIPIIHPASCVRSSKIRNKVLQYLVDLRPYLRDKLRGNLP